MWVHIPFIRVYSIGRGSTCKKDNAGGGGGGEGGSQQSLPLYEMADICQLQSVPLIDTVLKFDRTGDFHVKMRCSQFTLGKHCTPTHARKFYFSFSEINKYNGMRVERSITWWLLPPSVSEGRRRHLNVSCGAYRSPILIFLCSDFSPTLCIILYCSYMCCTGMPICY